MNILFIHQSFPGQFVHLSRHLAEQADNRVLALGMHDNPVPVGVEFRLYRLLRGHAEIVHPLLADQEAKVLRAEACAAAMMQLKSEGFQPDVVYAHPGWGEALFVKDVFPQAKLIVYCEFYYAAEGRDVGFDPEMPALSFQQRCALRMRNSINLLSIEAADLGIAPTQWQKSVWPDFVQHKIQVIHDGIDTESLQFDENAELRLAANCYRPELVLNRSTPIVSFMARNLEPVRGFHIFMRALPQVLQLCPGAHVILIGGDGISYGAAPIDGISWKDLMLQELDGQLDMRRVHFVGQVPYDIWIKTLSLSRLHFYWTTPFVLSWSFLEAALFGQRILASATPPVSEFAPLFDIQTVDFFDVASASAQIVKRLSDTSSNPVKMDVPELKLKYCLKKQLQLIL